MHSNATKDLQNKVDGYIKTNSEALSYARSDLELRDQAVANALREFQTGLIGRKSKGARYVKAVREYFLNIVEINHLEMLEQLLKIFRIQLENLYNEFFKKFTYTLDNLGKTFSCNLYFLLDSNYDNNTHSKPIVTISELTPYLDSSVKQMRISGIVHHFMDSLMCNENICISQDENKISVFVAKHFSSKLDYFTNKTITDYLQIRFKTTDPNLLKDKIYNEIMIPEYKAANPLLWVDAEKYQINNSYKYGYCSISEISHEIKAASDELYSFDNTVRKRVVENFDGISISQMLIGVPLFAYKGVSEYYDIYRNKKLEGLHIYEGRGKNAKDFRKLPDILPYSIITGERTPTQLDNSDEYDFAFNNGIIIVNEEIGEYRIGIFDLNDYNNLKIKSIK